MARTAEAEGHRCGAAIRGNAATDGTGAEIGELGNPFAFAKTGGKMVSVAISSRRRAGSRRAAAMMFFDRPRAGSDRILEATEAHAP